MAQIFISHSKTDSEQAAELLAWLHAQGFVSTFLDFDERRGIAPGADWERTLYRELSAADAVILVLTNNWFRSKWCFVEFAQARALGKAIFPLIQTATKEKFVSSDIQHLDLVKDREGGMERLRAELTRISLDSRGGFPWDPKRAPYPGLSAFDEPDAAIYFGRDDEIRRLIERLNARRAQGGEKLVVVLGSSGSGKSSLLRAGVLPRLRREAHKWIVLPPFRPQLHSLDELAQAISIALGDASNWRQWRSALEAEDLPHALSELARDIRAAHKENEAEILVTIDQSEELLGGTDAKQADRFFAVLNAMLTARLPFLVVMTLRSDYLGRLQREPRLAAPFEQYSLKPMPLERIRDIVQGPAKTAGIAVDDALVSAVIADARTDDALPLLAFAMRELYDRSAGSGRLTADAYHALGDVQAQLSPLENAVRRRADEVLGEARPSQEDLQALKEAFIPAMVRVNPEGEYARRPAVMSAISSRAMPLIERLATARLLTVRQEQDVTFVEVAHEALLRKWPLLRGWLDEEREFLIGKDQLEQDLLDWERAPAAQKNDAMLWGLKLARAESWLTAKPRQLSQPERRFIEASVQFAAARRRLRILRTMGTLVGGLCLIFGSVIAIQVRKKHDAMAAEVAARLTTSETDLAFAAEEMERGETPVSLAFLGDALRKNPRNGSAIALAIAELRDSEVPLLALRNGNEVQDADFSPDGTLVVTASADGTARVWSTQTGQQIGSDMKHTDWVHTAEFSPDGTLVVTASYDGTAGVWDVRTGHELHSLEHGVNAKVYSAHFSKDGNYIVTASLDRTARVWDAHTGLPVGQPLPSDDTVWDAVFDPTDDMHVLTGSADDTARLWDVRTGKELMHTKYDGEVSCIAFSPDGRWFVVAAGDGKAQIWDAHSLRPVGKTLLHDKNAPVYAVSFSPDTGHPEVATASGDDTARLWKVPSGEPIGEPMFHAGWVRAANFSSDGLWLVTASYDRTARVWNAQTATPVSPPMRHSGAVYMAHFDPKDTSVVVTASFDHTARIWRWHDTKPLPALRGSDVLEQACWDEKAQRILTVSATGTQIWDSRTGQPTGQRIATGSAETIAACSSDGQWLVTASAGSAQIWNPNTGQPVSAPFHLPAPPLTPDAGRGLRFDPRNRWFAVIANQGVWLWDPKTAQQVSANPIQMRGNTILGANFSPDGSMIVTYSREGAAAVWSVPDGIAVGKPVTHDGKITTARFSPDGKLLLTASSDHTARIWDVQSGKQMGVLHLDSWVPDAEFSPNGNWIVTACADFTAQVWDARTYKPAGQLMRNHASVIHVEFSPDGRWVLTLSGDGTAQVWDAATGDPVIEPFKGPQPDQSQLAGAGFSPDGNWVLTFWNDASDDKNTRAWQVQVHEAPITGTSAPQWLISLAEGVGGLSVNSDGALEPTPENEDPVLLRQQLTTLPDTDAMDRFGHWLISDPETRPVSPKSDR